jgi:hypothetical protein
MTSVVVKNAWSYTTTPYAFMLLNRINFTSLTRSPKGINISLQAYENQKNFFVNLAKGKLNMYAVHSGSMREKKKNVMSGNGHPLESTLMTQTECSLSLIQNPITVYQF